MIHTWWNAKISGETKCTGYSNKAYQKKCTITSHVPSKFYSLDVAVVIITIWSTNTDNHFNLSPTIFTYFKFCVCCKDCCFRVNNSDDVHLFSETHGQGSHSCQAFNCLDLVIRWHFVPTIKLIQKLSRMEINNIIYMYVYCRSLLRLAFNFTQNQNQVSSLPFRQAVTRCNGLSYMYFHSFPKYQTYPRQITTFGTSCKFDNTHCCIVLTLNRQLAKFF